MNPFVNRQNKHHHALFKGQDKLFESDSQLTWLDVYLYLNGDKLNKRIAKISPRRGKQEIKRLVKQCVERDGLSQFAAEMIYDDRD